MTNRQRLAIAVVVLGVGVGVTVLVLREGKTNGAAPPRSAQPSSERPHGVAPASPELADSARAGSAVATGGPASSPRVGSASEPPARIIKQGVGFELPGSLATIPDRYELQMIDNRAFVSLAGGPSQLYPGGGPMVRGSVRPVRGRVVDASDRPVAGAIVILDDRLAVMAGHLNGYAGATTDARGDFVTNDAPTTAMVAIAFAPSGWSDVVEVGSTPLVLRLRGHGSLRGRVTYNGRGDSFNLQLRTRPASNFSVHYQTDADGGYTIASLPPGDYTVEVRLAQAISGGVSKTTDHPITIARGSTFVLDVAQHSAAVVVVEPDLPAGYSPNIVEYWLFTGDRAPADLAAVRARGKAERVPAILFGGVDAMTPNQFHDVSVGSYTTCVVVDRDALFGCTSFVVLDGDTAREIDVRLAPPKG